MAGFMDSPVMAKLQTFGQKLGSNKFLSSLQGTMMGLMAVIMVGAISQIVCTLGSESMLGFFTTGDAVYNALHAPNVFTMSMLSLWVALFLGYNYAKTLKLEGPLLHGVTSAAMFMMVAAPISTSETGAVMLDTTYLGATGMFVSFLVAAVSVRIAWVCKTKNLYIHMPDVVPEFLQESFATIVPLLFSSIVFAGISFAITAATGGAFTLCSGFMAVLSIPLSGLTSPLGIFILLMVAMLLWCFGIHGSMLFFAVAGALSIQASTANAAAVAGGMDPVFYPILLSNCLACAGGTGNTLSLAALCSFSKSKQLKAVGRASVIPGIFNINEPVIFGTPIMYNPIMCIPFVLNVAVGFFFYWLGYATGILTPAWIPVFAALPIGVGSYLGSLSIVNALWDVLMIPISGLIYFPFFKAYERQLIKQEEEAAALEASA